MLTLYRAADFTLHITRYLFAALVVAGIVGTMIAVACGAIG